MEKNEDLESSSCYASPLESCARKTQEVYYMNKKNNVDPNSHGSKGKPPGTIGFGLFFLIPIRSNKVFFGTRIFDPLPNLSERVLAKTPSCQTFHSIQLQLLRRYLPFKVVWTVGAAGCLGKEPIKTRQL